MSLRLPIMDIKSTLLRRVALVAVFIPVAALFMGVAYLIAVPVIVWGGLKAAVEGFAEEWSFQFNGRATPVLTKMFKAAWKADWRNNAD